MRMSFSGVPQEQARHGWQKHYCIRPARNTLGADGFPFPSYISGTGKNDRTNAKDQNEHAKRLRYYSYFSLLCIDEFPNAKIRDEYLVQEFFNERYSAGNSTIICSQAPPEKWPDLFEVKSFGQSIRGRLQEHAHILEMKGPDLRLFKPSSD